MVDEESKKKKEVAHVHSVFESISKNYDWMNSIMSLGLHKKWRKKAIEELGIQPGDRVLDLCCGTCDWTISLAQTVGSKGQAVGLDFSKEMLKVGQEKIEERGLTEQVELVEGDALDLPFGEDEFDYVTIGFGLRNVRDIWGAFSEMKRVVKDDGAIASLELSKPPNQLYRKLYFFYLYKIIPSFAKIFMNKSNQYLWLAQSLEDFPEIQELEDMLYQAGFEQVSIDLFLGGAIALHIAEGTV
ncbi:demethylmenaquinone methyltransferase [Natroniella sulfidigena]|uniref:demethylmenaquinone methyltransferase n=1 Tax=Natroniella sulfidigena TaxID=723921 RepID=UPI00200A5525|nr:demethylmenaquinone methyltransferase [Natroniella sulfidigena]MCK8815902.1 demethylmenaquinone methyltransferase [Natroniella sulfidigena]